MFQGPQPASGRAGVHVQLWLQSLCSQLCAGRKNKRASGLCQGLRVIPNFQVKPKRAFLGHRADGHTLRTPPGPARSLSISPALLPGARVPSPSETCRSELLADSPLAACGSAWHLPSRELSPGAGSPAGLRKAAQHHCSPNSRCKLENKVVGKSLINHLKQPFH